MKVKVIGKNNYLGDMQEEFFLNRGIENYKDFLTLNGLKETNPFEFTNMEEAVNLLIERDGCNVGIVGDSDVDGISSLCVLYNYMDTYMESELKITIHRKKTHGIIMEELEEDGILGWADILIVPDAGSSDYEQHKILKEKYGITTIVIDHHQTDFRSKDAIVINNQLDGISENLTGSGLTYKFIQGIDSVIEEEGADDFLDLTAMGLIGDMAEARDYEVQSIIRKGVKNFQNEFIQNVIDNDFFIKEGSITSTTLSFSIIPMINACTRVSEFEEMKVIVEAMCNIGADRIYPYTANRGKNKGVTIDETLYEHAYRIAKRCKSRQDSMVKKTLFGSKRPLKKGLFDIIKEDNLINDEDKILIFDITDISQDSGLSGLIANKLMYQFNKPVLVLTKKEKTYLGSGRGEQIQFLRTKLEKSGFFISAKGHEPAFGVRLDAKTDLEELKKKLNRYFGEEETEAQFIVDFNIPVDELDKYTIADLANLEEFFGAGLKAPKIYIQNVKIKTSDINTGSANAIIKFTHFESDVQFVKFKVSADMMNELVDWNDEMCYNVIGVPSIDSFKGDRVVQLILNEIERVPLDDDTEDIDEEAWKEDEEGDNIEW